MTRVTLDYGNMLSPSLDGRGTDPERLQTDLAERFRSAFEVVEASRVSGETGFFRLPHATEMHQSTRALADRCRPEFDNLVVLGIGGSALGTLTLRDALLGPLWNELHDEARGHLPRIFVLDNVDPTSVRDLLAHIDIGRTLFNVVSKSGATAETMALFLVIEAYLVESVGGGEAPNHFVFTTDPERGVLRSIAEREGIASLPIPPDVGGRFSILSPVALFPAAVAGIDTTALLTGAALADERCRSPVLMENPAGVMATLLHAAHTESGASIHVMMPYSDRLRSFSRWFQQLWAESLGKAYDLAGNLVNTGPTPLPAVGVSDQHSQVQLFMEGPRDKVVVFLAVTGMDADVKIGSHRSEPASLSYLGGQTVGHLLEAERRATTEALRQNGRPTMTLEIHGLDAEALGELLMLMSISTVYAGALYGVDPLGQPGVELGKRLTYGLLGREGFEGHALPDSDPRWRV